MEFLDWLYTATTKKGLPLSKRTAEHYESGFRIISKEMQEEKVILKPLEKMNIQELDLAISIIFNTPSFIAKDSIGKKMYSNALKRYRCYVYLNTDIGVQEETQEAIIKNDISLSTTEKETIIKARRGQGLYREKLMQKYNKSCIVTGTNISQVLVASHIKPWAVCSNTERIDVDNGLLLSATFDRLFDSGLITFDKKGKMAVSSMVNKENIKRLNINTNISYNIKYSANMQKYLDYHNQFIFVS